jgi:surfactin family lipopeptide synthetase C
MKVKNIEAIYPLSPVQEALLQDQLGNPQSIASRGQWRCELRGNLDVSAFERAWQQAAKRNPLLRAFFVWENLDQPLQLVRSQEKLSVEQHDWRTVPAKQQRELLDQLLEADLARGFDLAAAPLLRLALCRTAPDTYQLIFGYHHLLLDARSLPLLLDEVFALYESIRQGRNSQTEAAPSFSK